MPLILRRRLTIIDETSVSCGTAVEPPLRKVAVVSVVENPHAGAYGQDLSGLIAASVGLGTEMAERAMAALGGVPAQSYGKAGIVGLAGEQEHANALLTTAFANPFRDALGGADAWISSMTKVAAPGTLIDVPMNHKDDVYVRSHYDGMSLQLPGIPMPDEVALIFCLATRGRPHARVGGMTHEEVLARKQEAAR